MPERVELLAAEQRALATGWHAPAGVASTAQLWAWLDGSTAAGHPDSRVAALLLALQDEVAELRAAATAEDGGWLYGFRRPADGEFYHYGDESQATRLAPTLGLPVHRRRVWYGPVEPVGEEGGGA